VFGCLGVIIVIIIIIIIIVILVVVVVVVVGPKLQYASVERNSIASTAASRLERIQRKFVSLCHRRVFSHLQ
jgi:uncharacterized membrane protein